MSISIKIVRVPGAVTELELQDGATVGEAMQIAGITAGEGETIKVGGATADSSTVLGDGDRVVIARGAKGNS